MRSAPQRWRVLAEAVGAVGVALALMAQRGADDLLTCLALLALYWLVGGVWELVDLWRDRRRWAWKALAAGAGLSAGLFVLRQPLWSTLLVPGDLAPALGGFGLAVGTVRLLRSPAGGGPCGPMLAAQSLLLGAVLMRGSPPMMAWAATAVTAAAGSGTLAWRPASARLVRPASYPQPQRDEGGPDRR